MVGPLASDAARLRRGAPKGARRLGLLAAADAAAAAAAQAGRLPHPVPLQEGLQDAHARAQQPGGPAAHAHPLRRPVPGAQAADRPPRAAQASRRAGPEAGHHRGGRHGRLRLAAPPPHPPGAAPLVGDDPAGKGRPGRRGGRVQRLRRARRAVRLAGLLPLLAGAAPARRRRRSGARGGGAPPAVGGDAQMRWYSTDAYGDVLPAASE
mmetsp:Transcript_36968/g.113437  ORF Transcript_36968/g.113437 Transcript_36968/m.113437 type:complete len:209 (+) Transcript_36968:22-648(+)